MSQVDAAPSSPGVPPVVRVEGLGHAYGKVRAIEGVSLDLPAGAMIGVIGPDGVGKSTLFSLIAGARSIQAGWVEVLGGDISDARHRSEICPRIAYMPQGLGKNLYPTLSVFENIDFFGRLFGHARHERERRIAELLDATGLAPFSDRPAGKLSGGMKQKLGLCCALIHDPDLLILDEPTTGLDPQSRHQVWDRLEKLKVSGLSVVLTTHYMEEASRLCDRLVIVDSGKILVDGSPAELIAKHAGRHVIEIGGPDQALRDFLNTRQVPHDDLGQRIILYTPDGNDLSAAVRENFCHEKCTFRNGTLEDVFLRLTGRELRE